MLFSNSINSFFKHSCEIRQSVTCNYFFIFWDATGLIQDQNVKTRGLSQFLDCIFYFADRRELSCGESISNQCLPRGQ